MQVSGIIDPMCTPRRSPRAPAPVLVAVVASLWLAACSAPERTGTSFCRQVARELPAIGQPIVTGGDVSAMVRRYERLLERAPLTIEADLAIVTDLLRLAASVDPRNEAEVQELADAAYASTRSATKVHDWVKDTCAVDIATGLTVSPPRTAPETTVPVSTTTVPATTTSAP